MDSLFCLVSYNIENLKIVRLKSTYRIKTMWVAERKKYSTVLDLSTLCEVEVNVKKSPLNLSYLALDEDCGQTSTMFQKWIEELDEFQSKNLHVYRTSECLTSYSTKEHWRKRSANQTTNNLWPSNWNGLAQNPFIGMLWKITDDIRTYWVISVKCTRFPPCTALKTWNTKKQGYGGPI